MFPEVKQAMWEALDQGNPSSTDVVAMRSKKRLTESRNFVYKVCNISPNDFYIIFTSGASESNNMILRSSAEAYKKMARTMPHIIVSNIEHATSLKCCKILEEHGLATVSYVACDPFSGEIFPAAVASAMRPNTCLVSIMHANNETGAINNIKGIGALCRARGVPFHTDAVQTFGKYGLHPNENNVDAFSVSFHKMGGPVASGMLVMRLCTNMWVAK
jgi:cysteine desulfurase